MADFYKSPQPTNDPNYLGMSKEPDRQQANTSMGQLFEGIGGVISKVGPAVNDLFKERIRDDAHKLIDPIQDAHGSNLTPEEASYIAGTGAKGRVRALQMKNGTGNFDAEEPTGAVSYAPEDAARDSKINSIFDSAVKTDKPLPPGATKEIDQLARMTKAYNSGALSDSYYNAQLVAVAKELRNRYPGWRDEVDQSISQITGVQPANALRASLQRDIQMNQAAMLAGRSNDDKYLEKNAGIINAIGLDPKVHPIETIKAGVNEFLGQKTILEAKQLKAAVGSPEAEAALSQTVAGQVQASIVQMSNKAQGGKSLADFTKGAEELTLKGGGSPKEVNDLVNTMTLRRNALEAQIRANAYKPIEGRTDGHSLVTLVQGGDQKFQTILTTQLKPWDDMIALVKSGNMSALQASTDAIKYQSNIDVQNLHKEFPQARVAAAINTVFPNNPIMANRFIETSAILPDWQKAITNGVGNAILGGSATTPAPKPSEAVKAYGEGATNGTVYKETIKQYNLVISPENKNTPNATHVAKQFFGDQKFYDDLNDSGRLKLFMTMASSEKTKYIKQLTDLDPDVGAAYAQWTKYAAGDIWRRNSSDLQSMIQDKRLDLRFNPKTLQFEDGTKYGPDATSVRWKTDSAQKISSINNAISLMKPIVGDEPKALLGALGINPGAEKENDVLQSVWKAIGDKLEDWGTEGVREDSKAGRKPVGKQSLAPTRAGEPHQTRNVIQGNLSDSSVVSWDTMDIPEGVSARDFIASLKKKGML